MQLRVAVENERNLRKDSDASDYLPMLSSSEQQKEQTDSTGSYMSSVGSGGSYITAFSSHERDRSKSINPLRPDVDLERLERLSRSGGSEHRPSIDFLVSLYTVYVLSRCQ